jgi:tRNA wybutosine-synthesizing protein 2
MFAKGNVHERGNLPKLIQPNEIIIDMFAGIGYFTLGMAKSGKPQKIYAIEWNPISYHYLVENLQLNHIEHIVQPIMGDCKIKVPELAAQGIKADRIIMGLLPAPIDAIPAALSVVRSEGTIILYEGIETEQSNQLYEDFAEIARNDNFHTSLLNRRLVKSYSPGLYHSVVEIFVKK